LSLTFTSRDKLWRATRHILNQTLDPRLIACRQKHGLIDTETAVLHYLTQWSRIGAYDRRQLDRWVYGDRLAYEY
jgi:hypothetical protein